MSQEREAVPAVRHVRDQHGPSRDTRPTPATRVLLAALSGALAQSGEVRVAAGKEVSAYRSVLAFQGSGALRSRPLPGGEHADRVGEAERDEHDRDDAESLLALGR